MESAIARFFGLPELVSALTWMMEPLDIISLMQTNRKIHDYCLPTLYHTVRITFGEKPCPASASTSAMQAFARNAHLIRSFTMGGIFAIYYYNCLLDYCDQMQKDAALSVDTQALTGVATTSTTTTTTTTTIMTMISNTTTSTIATDAAAASVFRITRPTWLPLLSTRTDSIIPLPPMGHLTELKVHFAEALTPGSHFFRSPNYGTDKSVWPRVDQVCWIMQLSPLLVDICIFCMELLTYRDGMRLLKTIYGLSRLQKLQLLLAGPYAIENWISSHLVFACPSNLESLSLDVMPDMGQYKDRSDQEKDLVDETDQADEDQRGDEGQSSSTNMTPKTKKDFYEGMLPHRSSGFLYRLSSLSFEYLQGCGYEGVYSIIRYCPSLQHFRVPCFDESLDPDLIGSYLVAHLPELKSLRVRITEDEGLEDTLPFTILYCMREGQLKELFLDWPSSPEVTSALIHRHASSLRKIDLSDGQGFESKSVQTILLSCAALEEFIMGTSQPYKRSHITLADAIEKPWVCTKLKTLEILFRFKTAGLFGKDGPSKYYNRQTPVVLSETERRTFASLEQLYRQIGSLTELEVLDIGATSESHRTQGRFRGILALRDEESLPGMLTLGDQEAGRPGYLSLLSGLTKLRSVYGWVFHVTNPEQGKTVGWAEVCWINETWARLREADFFPFRTPKQGSPKMKPEFKWLQDRQPSLTMWRENPIEQL
ncbi:hypothetical protein BGX33_005334 [Mortierella sp. NVP41]|nr:hypothetical protein BGX33_005334 [Mortierella sp. NVP41]